MNEDEPRKDPGIHALVAGIVLYVVVVGFFVLFEVATRDDNKED